MPKTAAAVLGFALVTGSIGFNTVRYPVVWQMVGSVNPSQPATESNPAVAAPQSIASEPTAPESPAPAAMRMSEPAPIATPDNDAEPVETKEETTTPESKPSPEATPASDPADKPTPAPHADAGTDGTAPPPSAATTAPQDDPEPAAEEPRKPLVPVLPVSIPNDSAGGKGDWSGIVRLPPVEHQGLGSNNCDTSRLFSGTLPSYPTTKTPDRLW